jgi:hypothetical protein
LKVEVKLAHIGYNETILGTPPIPHLHDVRLTITINTHLVPNSAQGMKY